MLPLRLIKTFSFIAPTYFLLTIPASWSSPLPIPQWVTKALIPHETKIPPPIIIALYPFYSPPIFPHQFLIPIHSQHHQDHKNYGINSIRDKSIQTQQQDRFPFIPIVASNALK